MTNSLKANMTGQVAVVGSRSFIAQALLDELDNRQVPVTCVGKSMLGILDMSRFDCVYLVLGRARPNPYEEAMERQQLAEFLGNPALPGRAVFISSQLVTESKRWCEERIREYNTAIDNSMLVHVIRPPAVFGPNQPLDSEMLVPSLVRTEGTVPLSLGQGLAKFVSVNDLARHLANFSDPDWHDFNWCGDPKSVFDVPGTFSMTPHQVRELYLTFEGLLSRSHQGCCPYYESSGDLCADDGRSRDSHCLSCRKPGIVI